MKEKVKIGYIGLGRRGTHVLLHNVSHMTDVEITMLCDLSMTRMENAKAIVVENMGHEPILTTDYHDVLNNPEIDAVMIMIGWSGRPQIAMESMRAGKYTAIEVGCADTLEECYDLIKSLYTARADTSITSTKRTSSRISEKRRFRTTVFRIT